MTEKDSNITTPTLLHPVRSVLRKWRSTWIVLIVGLMITAAATLYMKSSVENIANLEFTSHCNEITNKITERLDDHARILRGGAALFNVSDIVTREEWRIFNKAQKVEKQLPGIQGIGFSLLIPRAELTRHIQKIRSEGLQQYKLRPDGEREIYSSIVYLEPFSGRNLRAFGYDMLSEPVRRSAMERARDTDTAALSGKVVLVQETGADIQAGTLMYVPVYRKGMPIETIEQRRASIYGWVYSPYRMNDLMQGIIGNRNLEKEKQVRLQVFDGTQPSIQSMLYDSHSAGDNALRANARFTRQIPVDFNGQLWTLRFTKTGGGFSTVDYSSIWLTMFGGILITLLFFSLIRALLNARDKTRLAESLTAELLASENKYQYLFTNAQVALFRTRTSDGKLLEINERYAQMAGYSNINDCIAEFNVSDAWADPDGRKILVGILQENGFVTDYETSIIRRDGTHVWILFSATIFPEQGFIEGSIVDITARKQAEEALRESEARFSLTVDAVNDGIWDWNVPSGSAFFSPCYYSLLGYDDGEFPANYASWRFLVHPEDLERVEKQLRENIENGKGFAIDLRMKLKSGRWKWVSTRGKVVKWDEHEKALRVVGALSDITDRKKSEEMIETSLREKETLLKEIHHRVKNNLQIISSLLNLQARSIGNEKLEGIFRECQDRITTMASVHQLLYKSQNFAEINFGEYVRETASQLFRSYKTSSAVISLVIHVDNIMLPIDTAIPCGLIINELITNTLKYAFPGVREGEIKIEMNRTENGIRLHYEDNGIGFPKDVDFCSTQTLGLKLVHMFVKQLDGSIEQDTNSGTRYVITFKTETLQEV